MKLTHFFLLLAALSFASCGDDDTQPGNDNLLHYDDENATGPVLQAGNHELAAFFPASDMAKHAGKKLKQVQFFAGQFPPVCKVKIYGNGTSSAPGALLYEREVTGALVQDWNTHTLTTPVDLTGEGIWISIFVTHAAGGTNRSIGCDSGPAKEGGDWLFSSTDGSWRTYRQRTNESVNWNIRGVLE